MQSLGANLYQSSFIRATREFSLVSKLGLSMAGDYDAYPTITPDLGFILFGSDRQSGPHVFIALKVNGGFDTSPVTEVAVGKQFSNEPYVVGDGSILYLSGADGSQNWDLYHATGTPPDYQGFTAIPGTNTANGEFAPVVTEDELELFFASDRE